LKISLHVEGNVESTKMYYMHNTNTATKAKGREVFKECGAKLM
jgi:hypothetical protein